MVKNTLFFLAFTAAGYAQMPTAVAPPAPPVAATAPADPNKIVLVVGDQKITAAQFDTFIAAMPPQIQAQAKGPQRREFAKNVSELMVLSKEAVRQGLDKDPIVQQQLQFSRDNMLAQVIYQKLATSATISDADVQAFYDAHKSEYETVTARHILIRVKDAPMPAVPGKPELSDAEAKAKAETLRKRLVAGEDFAAMAKAESDDVTSGAMGGDLGSFQHGMMVPPFETAAFALKAGEISQPVQTPFGYHLIQAQSHTSKSLADMKDEILNQMKPDAAKKALDALVQKANVTIDDAYFGSGIPTGVIPAIAQ